MKALPEWPRPTGMDDWTEDDFVAFSDNLSHHLFAITRAVGRPLREVFWLWHRVLSDLPGDEVYPAFIVREWGRLDAALRRKWTVDA